MREPIFLQEMPLVLEALRFGDGKLFEAHKELDEANIIIRQQASGKNYKTVMIGSPKDYR